MITGPKKLKKIAYFVADLFNLERFHVEIRTIKKREAAFCACLGGRNFILEIGKFPSKKQLVEAIGHEMVHVKQYLNGELKDVKEDEGYATYWRGNRYWIEDEDLDAYFLCPWEMEARALESWISSRWRGRRNNELYGRIDE